MPNDRFRTGTHSRRTVLTALGHLPAASLLDDLSATDSSGEPTSLLAPDVLPQPVGEAVTVTGKVTAKNCKPVPWLPVAAYTCPFCGARRSPPGLDEDVSLPVRLCSVCAVQAGGVREPQRRELSLYNLTVRPPETNGKHFVFVPEALIGDWDRFGLGTTIRVSGTQRELAPILQNTPEMSDSVSPEEADDRIARLAPNVWTSSTVQVLADTVTLVGGESDGRQPD